MVVRKVVLQGYAPANRRMSMMNSARLKTQRDAGGAVVGELSAAGFDDAEEIGRGGFGVVYRCTQVALDRTVAVKVLTTELDENRERFLREQRAMGRLTGHRNVKPGNILYTDFGEPALSDFGIAHFTGGFKTATGTFTGSPAFTAPEILSGDTPSAASDVYGLGATLFAALTGHAAYERRSGEQVVAQFLRIALRTSISVRAVTSCAAAYFSCSTDTVVWPIMSNACRHCC